MSGDATPVEKAYGPLAGDGGRAALVFGAVALPSSVVGALINGSTAGLATGVLGPWAGVAVGHHECTMATQVPMASIGLVFAGFALVLGLALGKPWLRGVLLVLLGVWALMWCGAGLLSIVNASV